MYAMVHNAEDGAEVKLSTGFHILMGVCYYKSKSTV